ncbi:MAG: hypothetical protein QW416_06115 [Candidatus Nitrosocaldaceae archaeon]
MKIIFIIFLLLIPYPVFADDDEDSAKMLGWAAIGAGALSNITFVIYNRVRKISSIYSKDLTRNLALIYKPMLSWHIMLNITGYIAGMMHGLLLIRYLDPISLSLAIIMTILVVSGLLLRYTSSRDLKLFNKLLHGQSVLTILLIILIVLHVLSADD